jgi:predicted negative regulator of RcsB-dependent stress response
MVNVTISLLTLVVLLCLVIVAVWYVSGWYFYKRHEKNIMKMEKCPYKNPCLKYDELETRGAVKRVAKLILENIEREELVKRKLYEDLASGKVG